MFFYKGINMKNTNDPHRNKTSDKGSNKDPETRDDSAIQPGVQTISDSDHDQDNEQLTDTAKGDLSQAKDKNAQPRFDEI